MFLTPHPTPLETTRPLMRTAAHTPYVQQKVMTTYSNPSLQCCEFYNLKKKKQKYKTSLEGKEGQSDVLENSTFFLFMHLLFIYSLVDFLCSRIKTRHNSLRDTRDLREGTSRYENISSP